MRRVRGFAATVLFMLAVAPGAWACDRTWDDGGATQDWQEAANWDGDIVPAAGEEVCIGSGFQPITYSAAGPASFNSIVMGTAVAFASGDVTFTGPTTSSSSARLVVSGTSTLTAAGPLILLSDGVLDLQGNSRMINSGTMTFAVPNGHTGADTALLRNTGTMSIQGSTGFAVPFENDGAVTVGEDLFLGRGTPGGIVSSGSWAIGNDDQLGFGSSLALPSHALTGPVTSTGSGEVLVTTALVTASSTFDVFRVVLNGGSLTLNGATDVANLNVAGGTAVVNDAIAPALVTLGDGTLGGSAAISSGSWSWSGGNLTGSGAATVNAGGTMTIATETAKALNGKPLTINGTANVSSALAVGGGAPITVGSGGALDFKANVALTGAGTLRTLTGGALRKSAPTDANDAATVAIPVDNDGAVSTTAWVLRFTGGGITGATSDGSWSASGTGGRIVMAGPDAQPFTLSGPVTAMNVSSGAVTSTGTFDVTSPQVTGGSLTLNGPTTIRDVFVSSGTMTINDDIAPAFVQQTGGTIAGTGLIATTATATWLWSGGTLGGTGTATLSGGATMNVSGDGTRTLDRPLRAGGTLDIAGQTSIIGAGTLTVPSGGTMRKTTPGGFTQSDIIVPFENDGTVSLNTGRFRLSGGGITGAQSSGTWTDIGGSVVFAGPVDKPYALTGSMQMGNAPTVEGGVVTSDGAWTSAVDVRNSGTLVLGGQASPSNVNVTGGTLTVNDEISPQTLTQSAGRIDGSGAISVTSSWTWTGGTLAGSGSATIPIGRSFAVQTATAKTLDGKPLRIFGTADVQSSFTAVNGAAVSVDGNPGIVNVFDGVTIGGSGTLRVGAGATLRKSSGAGTARIELPIDNDGTVTPLAGILAIVGGGIGGESSAGTWTIPGGTQLTLGGAQTHTLTGPVNGAANSRLVTSGSPLVLEGALQLDRWSVTGGVTTRTIGATGVTRLDLSGGELSLNTNIVSQRVVHDGGTLSGSGTLTTPDYDWLAGVMAGPGTTVVAGMDAALDVSSNDTKTLNRALTAGGSGALRDEADIAGTGTLIVPAGAALQKEGAGVSEIAVRVTNSGSLGAAAGGTLRLAGSFDSWHPETGTLDGQGELFSSGVVEIPGLDVQTLATTLGLYDDGTIRNTAGTPQSGLRNLATIAPTGTLVHETPVAVPGTLVVQGALELRSSVVAPLVDVDGGRVEGGGVVTGALRNGGVVAPAHDPQDSFRTLTVTQGYEQLAAGRVELRIANAGVRDRLAIGGNATLGGTLALEYTTDPPLDDTSQVLTYASRSGSFASITGALLSATKRARPEYGSGGLSMVIEPPPTISVGDITVAEGAGQAIVPVTLSAVHTEAVTVRVSTAPDGAAAPQDYSPTAQPLTFAPGQTQRTVNVPIADDSLDEDDERFFVDLADPVLATLSDAQAQVTIADDDALPTLSPADAVVTEGGVAIVNLTLSPVSGRTVTVAYATIDDGASAPGDYASKSGTITFAAGETVKSIAVQTAQDAVDEPDEQFFVDLSNIGGAAFGATRATVRVTDDDPTPAGSDGSVGGQRPPVTGTSKAALSAKDVLSLPRTCVGGTVSVAVKRPRGVQLKRVEIKVNGIRIKKVVFAKIGKRVDARLPARVTKAFTLEAVAVTVDGLKLSETTKLKACLVKAKAKAKRKRSAAI